VIIHCETLNTDSGVDAMMCRRFVLGSMHRAITQWKWIGALIAVPAELHIVGLNSIA
jgi:hypothetical protein